MNAPANTASCTAERDNPVRASGGLDVSLTERGVASSMQDASDAKRKKVKSRKPVDMPKRPLSACKTMVVTLCTSIAYVLTYLSFPIHLSFSMQTM